MSLYIYLERFFRLVSVQIEISILISIFITG